MAVDGQGQVLGGPTSIIRDAAAVTDLKMAALSPQLADYLWCVTLVTQGLGYHG